MAKKQERVITIKTDPITDEQYADLLNVVWMVVCMTFYDQSGGVVDHDGSVSNEALNDRWGKYVQATPWSVKP